MIAPAGLGDLNNRKVESVTVFQNSLYLTLNNIHTGIEVWRSANGTTWERVNQDGFGDSHNTGSNWSNASAGFKCQLYVGTANALDGGELWRQQKLYDVALSVDQAKQGSAGSQVSYTLSITNTGVMTDNFTLSATGQTWVTNLAPALVNLPPSASANINVTVTIPPGAPNQAVDTATITAASQSAGCQIDTATVTTTAIISVTPSISLSNTTVNENQPVNTVVGVLSMTNPNPGATYTYSLTCAAPGADDASFNVNGTNLRTSAIFNFEAKSTYNICIRATDQLALTFDKNFVISVNNVNEPPTNITLSNSTVDENLPVNTVVGALTATDPDGGATFTFSLTCAAPGADDASFNINGTNLRTSASFNFEAKSMYNICLRVTDQGGLTFDKNFGISVNNINEPPTNIILSSNTVDENQPINTIVGALSATDPDAGATFTFSLTCAAPGADDGSFNILGTNLRTSAIFDYETKSTYNICLRVTDQGGLTFDKNFVISVNNVNEPPTNITLSNNTVNENQPINTVVGALSATDPDAGATFTFSLTCAAPGADDTSFNVSGTNLRTSAIFDYETKSTYNICLRVTDQGGLTFDKNFVITVNNLPEGMLYHLSANDHR